jgi:hypothetical protein
MEMLALGVCFLLAIEENYNQKLKPYHRASV